MLSRLMLVPVACALVLLAACGSDDPPRFPSPTPGPLVQVLPRIPLNYGSGNLLVEVATAPAQTEMGLGYRDALFERGGMLFELGSTRLPGFWMKGMRFPLDMVWIGEDKKIVEITADVPTQPGVPDAELKLYTPAIPVRYVLELNAGAAAGFGMSVGTQLTFDIPINVLITPTPTPQPTPTPTPTP